MDRAAAAQTLADALGARGPVRLERFHGGAGPETWLVRNGSDRLVLRTDAATRLEESGTRAQEFAALQRAHHAAVPTPQPLHLERDPSVLGAPFFLMSHAPGTARPGDVVSQAGPAFLADCAAALACIHAAPAPGPVDAVARALDEAERRIRWLAPTRPALRYLLTWARVNAPPPAPTVFAHRDFRVGNLLASRGRLTAVIDWEFAGLSEREEDLGWFCAPAWRHGWLERTAGGIGSLEAWLAAYGAASGHRVDPARVRWWMVMGQLRWALIALEQAQRALTGQPDLDLALTAHRLPSIERDGLDCIAPPGGDAYRPADGLFTEDGPAPDELLAIASRAPVETEEDHALLDMLNALVARLRAAPLRDRDRARALTHRASRPDALTDSDLWSTLRAEAAARAEIGRRDA